MDPSKLKILKELLLQAIRKIEILIDLEHDWPLMPKQELFCRLYASDREFFGNGVQAYAEAYNLDLRVRGMYNVAAASASRLLMNVKILNRIDELLEDGNLNDAHVDKQLAFWITQKANPQASVAAIKEYNALKQRITKKLDVMSGGLPLKGVLVEFVGDDGTTPTNQG